MKYKKGQEVNHPDGSKRVIKSVHPNRKSGQAVYVQMEGTKIQMFTAAELDAVNPK